jgi:hypothetical protein
MSTPSTVDNFTRFWQELFEDKSLITIAKAFQGFFGRVETGAKTVITDKMVYDIDIQRGNKKIAALIPRGTVSRSIGSNQRNLNVDKFSTFSRKFPLAEEEGDINAEDLGFRRAGESPYETASRLTRLRSRGVDIVMENIRRIGDMFEVLAAQSVLTGKQDTIIGTTNPELQYDFRRDAALTVSIVNKWDGGSADPIGDLEALADKIKTKGRVMPDYVGMDGGSLAAFLKNTDVKEVADNRRYELIRIGKDHGVPSKLSFMVEAGWIAFGSVKVYKGYEFWIFTNQDYYEDNDGNVIDHVPSGTVLMGSSKARADRLFGPGETLPMIPMRQQLYSEMFGMSLDSPPVPAGTYENGIIRPDFFMHDAYVSDDWKKVTMRTQAAPIFSTTHTDAFGTLTDVLT